MNFGVRIDGEDVSNIGLVDSLEIMRNTRESISTAHIVFQQRLNPGDKFEARAWVEWQSVEIFDAETDAVFFDGYIAEMIREPQDNEKFRVDVRAVDQAVLLDRKVSASVFTGVSDHDIAEALITEAAQGLTAGAIDNTNVLAEFDARDMTIREAFDRLCEITGCRYNASPGKVINYFKPGLHFAPWNLSDAPDNLLSYPYQMQQFQRSFTNAANRLFLLGTVGEDGSEVRAFGEDEPSVAQYGELEGVIVDRTIGALAVANLVIASELSNRAYPRTSGRALLRYPVPFEDLSLGEMIGVESALYDVDENLQINSMRFYTDARTRIACELEFGARESTFDYMIRQLARKDPQLQSAVIGPDTVIPADQISGVIGAEHIGGVAAENISGVIFADQIGTVHANSIEGVIGGPGSSATINAQSITAGVLGGPGSDVEIDATKITVGLIVGEQLTDQILDTLRLVGPGMGVVERIPSGVALPALPNLEYPIGSTVLQSAIYGVSHYGTARYGSQLYENIANVWTPVAASAKLTGVLKYSDIESIKAAQITGVIAASQIGSIEADQITGIIQGDQIGEINAASITSLNAGDITMVTKWDETRIQSVNASSITAGTIAATVTMTSPDIHVTGSGYNLVLNNTVGLEITQTGGTGRVARATDAQYTVSKGAALASLSDLGLTVAVGSIVSAGLTGSSSAAVIGAAYSSNSFQVTSDSSGVNVMLQGSTTSIQVLGSTSYVYAAQLRTVINLTSSSVPTTYARYINAYDSGGSIVGKIPIF